jgi:uncharacterized protein
MDHPETDFLCVRCARHMKTCCQTSEVYITPGDVGRIREYTGQDGFHEFRAPVNPVYLDQEDDPAWAHFVFREDGTRRVLKRHPAGDCTFLGEAGCRLPLEVRPLVCRLYPYDYTEEGIREELAQGCPLELIRPGLTLIDELGMNRSDAERWHGMLYREIRQERPHEDRSDV